MEGKYEDNIDDDGDESDAVAGSRDGAVMWPRFDSRTRCHMWVEFVVGSRPCSDLLCEVFLRVLRFSPLPKNQHFQIPTRSGICGPQVCQLQETVKCHPFLRKLISFKLFVMNSLDTRFSRNVFEAFKKLAARVLSGLKPLSYASWC